MKLYTKPYCPLCDLVREGIEQVNLEFTEVNIEEDSRLLELYRNDIPVVEFHGKKWFYRQRDEMSLELWLAQLKDES
jgi:glutaredoxin